METTAEKKGKKANFLAASVLVPSFFLSRDN
jgi:hypothetical protein